MHSGYNLKMNWADWGSGAVHSLIHTNIELGNNLMYLRKPFNFDVHSPQISSWSTTEKCFLKMKTCFKPKYPVYKIYCKQAAS